MEAKKMILQPDKASVVTMRALKMLVKSYFAQFSKDQILIAAQRAGIPFFRIPSQYINQGEYISSIDEFDQNLFLPDSLYHIPEAEPIEFKKMIKLKIQKDDVEGLTDSAVVFEIYDINIVLANEPPDEFSALMSADVRIQHFIIAGLNSAIAMFMALKTRYHDLLSSIDLQLDESALRAVIKDHQLPNLNHTAWIGFKITKQI